MNKFRDSIAGSIIILALICGVVTAALAGTNNMTKDIISENKNAAAFAAFENVMPGATFKELNIELPAGVALAAEAEDGSGYVFSTFGKGYGGEVNFVVAMDKDGNFTGIEMVEGHPETPGIGTRVGSPDYLAKYYGTNSPDAVDALGGATRTSEALKQALTRAVEAYGKIGG